jgi:ACS family glucarate transporter-like MFS transporter
MNSSPARPTRVRYGVLGFACALSMITYLDRACFGVANKSIIAALGLNSIADLTYALTAFNLAYAVFEVPTGWLGDVFGPRTTLIRIVLWWSAFTALTGLAGLSLGGGLFIGLNALIAIRFLFGIGEAGAYPNITRALHNWFPLTERGMAQGFLWMTGRLMGGLTPLIWWVLVQQLGLSWRATFWLFGGLGVIWCVNFMLWFRNRPEEKEGVNAAELELIRRGTGTSTEPAHANVPWLKLLASGNLWALCLMYFCVSYGWYFHLNYLPNYLEQQHHIGPDDPYGPLYKGGPLTLGAAGCLIGGWLTDRYIRRTGDRRLGRKLYGMIGHGICIPCFLYCAVAPDAVTFAVAIALAGFANDLAMSSAWAACQDLGRRHAAIVAGCMNTVGNLGGAAATWATGMILRTTLNSHAAGLGVSLDALKNDPAQADRYQEVLRAGQLSGYNLNFLIYAGMYALAVVCWLRFDATQPLLPEDSE